MNTFRNFHHFPGCELKSKLLYVNYSTKNTRLSWGHQQPSSKNDATDYPTHGDKPWGHDRQHNATPTTFYFIHLFPFISIITYHHITPHINNTNRRTKHNIDFFQINETPRKQKPRFPPAAKAHQTQSCEHTKKYSNSNGKSKNFKIFIILSTKIVSHFSFPTVATSQGVWHRPFPTVRTSQGGIWQAAVVKMRWWRTNIGCGHFFQKTSFREAIEYKIFWANFWAKALHFHSDITI